MLHQIGHLHHFGHDEALLEITVNTTGGLGSLRVLLKTMSTINKMEDANSTPPPSSNNETTLW